MTRCLFSELQPLQANQERGTAMVVASVVKQLITTMNPSKVRLPACVLECRLSWRVMQMLLADQSSSTISQRVRLRWRDWRR